MNLTNKNIGPVLKLIFECLISYTLLNLLYLDQCCADPSIYGENNLNYAAFVVWVK